MMLAIRKALTRKQWKRLGEVQDLRNTSSALILSADIAANSSSTSDAMTVITPFEERVYSIEDGITLPEVLYRPMPAYTQEARDAKAEGLVLLEVIIRKDRSVDSIKVLRAVGYGLDESAMHTIAKEWRFSPGTLNGKPVDV